MENEVNITKEEQKRGFSERGTCEMKCFELTFIVEDSQQERLAALAERFGRVNGWGEKDILQFAVAAVHQAEKGEIKWN